MAAARASVVPRPPSRSARKVACFLAGYSSAVTDEMVVRYADRRLRPYVGRLWGYAHRAPAAAQQREPLATGVVLIFGLGVPLGIADPSSRRPAGWCGSFVGGVVVRCAVFEHKGEMRGIQVDLSPLAARMIFRVSMRSLSREVVALDDLLGPGGCVLEERLIEASSWQERFGLVEAALAAKLQVAEPPPPDVDWAWRRVLSSRGLLKVSELTKELGCSRKHLAARFREHVGVSPKRFARMLRFPPRERPDRHRHQPGRGRCHLRLLRPGAHGPRLSRVCADHADGLPSRAGYVRPRRNLGLPVASG